MPFRSTRLGKSNEELEARFAQIREKLEISVDFPAEVERAAQQAVVAVALVEEDATDIELVTIDPEGSRDLDQALHIAETDGGYVVHYAIADLSVIVAPGGVIEKEARKRGQTMYAPDQSAPLHPRLLSEGAASLLPGEVRAAYVWRFELDADANVRKTTLRRAKVKSREQLSYVEAQKRADAGDALMALLREVGERRIRLEELREGAALDMPDEEITKVDGEWTLTRRELLAVEQWNAQLSLMTGMAAATLQLQAGAGVVRVMPRPSADAMAAFQREVALLGHPFHAGEPYGAYLRRLDRTLPETLAILVAARSLFRGAGYAVLTGGESEQDVIQAAIGAPYAHATAPLRRLVDRYVLAHCEAIANSREVPDWATAGLEDIAEIMASSGQKAAALERECIAAVAAVLLADRVGDEFAALVVGRRETRAELELTDPPVSTTVVCDAKPGDVVRVRLESIDEGKPAFVLVNGTFE